jgi:TonB family protein
MELNDSVLSKTLLLSLAMHFLLLHFGSWRVQARHESLVEIDITNMGSPGIAGPAHRSTRVAPPTTPAPTVPHESGVKPVQPTQSADPPTTQAASEAASSISPTGPAPVGEYAVGDGKANVLSQIPQLLNLSDLRAILQRFYPEAARSQGREALVVLDIHVDSEGHVSSADIVRSGGADFDEAAKKVAVLLHFTPAFIGSERVAVKMRQAVQFKLER